jgi:hypothetical protein
MLDNTVYAANAIQVRQTDNAGNTSVAGKISDAITTDMLAPTIVVSNAAIVIEASGDNQKAY